LDHINKLQYQGELPDHIQGNVRNSLIRSYQTWKGTNFVPPLTHPALRWSATDPLPLLPVVTDVTWQIVDKDKQTKVGVNIKNTNVVFTAVDRSTSIKSSRKRKLEGEECNANAKKQKTSHTTIIHPSKKRKFENEDLNVSVKRCKKSDIIITSGDNISSPAGLKWDGEDYSCAYDAFFVILYDIWSTNPRIWTQRFNDINLHNLKSMSAGFKSFMKNQADFEAIRDNIRRQLHAQNSTLFPYGTGGTSVTALASVVLAPSKCVAVSNPICLDCGYTEDPVVYNI
jgi:hypothetical protein